MKFLYIFSQAPYSNPIAKEALDMALASAAFDQDVSVVFTDEGLLQLLHNQKPSGPHKKSQLGAINALPLYDIAQVYYLQSDLTRLGLKADALVKHATSLDQTGLQRLITQNERVQSF